ncbi:putative transcription factor C3H family [Helianthus annuus]|nr:putative transcription factor C3H family [Helianthus annuus]KAJ0711482.1 putative transcription factor C3H family [Helianthus annuus]
MDFPSFNHHHHRYAPPPPPPTNFPDDRPNYYPPHHHIPSVNHLPPPPLPYPHPPPPPPPPLSVHVPRPSQSYNPDFTFLDAQKSSFFTHNRSSPPRVSGSNHSYRFDYRNDFRSDPARVPPELPHRNRVPEEHQDYHRSMYSSNPQSESYYKSASRFIDDNINDGYGSSIVSSNIDSYASVRSVVIGGKSSTGKDYVDKYEPRYVSMSENDRIWEHHGDEDPKWVMKVKSEVGRNDGGSFAYGRERERDRDYEHESGKFNRVREGRDREEFKQVQKKSVLLRIGKPNNTNRNRNYEQHASKGYLVESNSSNHRGKDKGKDRDRDRDHTGKECRVEGDRARSPVDLDVSFKSNALVAKPVVTPSSPLSDNNNTQTKNRKVKRVNEFGSPLSKFSECSTRSRSSSRGFDSPSSSEKAPKQQTHKDSVSNEDNSSLLAPVLDQGDGNGGSKAQPLSFRLKKKRKLMNPASRSFNFQLAVKDDKIIKGENLENTPIAPVSSTIPFPTLEETVDSKVDKSPQASLLEKDGSEVRNLNPHCMNSFADDCTENKNLNAQNVSMINDGLGNELNQQPCGNDVSVNLENDAQNISPDVRLSLGGTDISAASGHNQVEIQKASTESNAGFDVVNVSNSLCNESVKTQEMNLSLHCINSFDDDCTENKSLTGQNVSMINDGLANELHQQQCGNEVSVNLENDTQNITTDVRLSLSGTDIANVVDASNSLCNEPVKIQETSTVSDMNDPLDSCTDDIDIIIVSPEKSDDQGFLDDVSRKEDESQLLEGSTSNQISFNRSNEYSEDALKDSIHTDIFAEDNATQSSSHKEHSFDKDAITEMVTPISTSVLIPIPDHRDQLSTGFKDDLPPSSSIVSAFVTDSNGKSGEYRPDILTGIFSPEKVSSFSDSQSLVSKSTDKRISYLGNPENDDNIIVKSVSKDIALSNAPKTGIKTSSVKTLGSNTNLQGSNLPLAKPSSVPAVPRVVAARSSPSLTNSRISKTANNATKPRTWRRSSSSPAPVPPPPKQTAMGQNSYIRSGNSLVRKAAPVTAVASRSSVYQLNPSAPNEARNSAVSGNKVNNTYSRVAGSGASVVRPKTPPLSGGTKLPDCPTYSRDVSSSPLELLPASPVEGNLVVQKVSEDQIRASNNSESQKVEDEVATGKKIQYVKRKSNQLVAASSSDQSVQELDKTQASSSSDSYYKRRKNQLIRTIAGNDSANTDVGKASKNSFKRQSGKVWTLTSHSLGKDGVSLRQKLRPQLFPWKRSRNLMNLSASISSNSSLSSISRKLLLSRKRETLYTRSKHGFSLRMSKLLSVGGSSLKWSKSIERNSKRTNEEATLAVAAAEKKKREQHGTVSATAEIKRRNNMSRVRIFRIGSVRYKMDPSKRTLQRISDGEPSNSMQSKEEIRKSYVPKRLKIGHDEYVRIGNGNQLVRNPKRRTRVFANEKVRWSLHTARTRLAKKKKFCQFFTRFGKCNKDDGKCPYIHDSSKIAVCTKFLNGSCSNPNCKLTHKVIPERMQDCSYFLQGLCSNNHCPYRHVNVNSAASVCEGFLKGYCADGNECRKKHSYACPAFEATGKCSQGTKCKLHHPKNQLKRKQQSTMDQQQKNSRGRYFGSVRVEEATGVSEKGVSEKLYLKNDDMDDDVDLCQEGKFAEYISLDVGNEEAGEVMGEARTGLMISEPLGLDADEFDELTKPIGIMNRVVLDSPSECDMGVS